jgi:transcriptional regulator with XRE-family HTH domain
VVGEMIKQRRLAKGLTQAQLAKLAGLRQTYISQVEAGEIHLPRDHNLDALGDVLGFSRPDFYRAAGVLEGIEVGLPPKPAPNALGDYDYGEVRRYVEGNPDPNFRDRLARQGARRSPDSYRRLIFRIFRAWLSNADLGLGEAEEGDDDRPSTGR